MGIELVEHPYPTWDKSRLINWNAIMSGRTMGDRKSIAAAELARCGSDATVTDTLLNEREGGVLIRELLHDEETGAMRDPRMMHSVSQQKRLFRIKWIRHQDGTPVKPGEVVSWKVAPLRVNPRTGAALQTRDLRAMRRRGEPTEFRHSAVVDQDGCILVPFSDASLLLSRFGFGGTANYKEVSGGKYNHLLVEEPLWVLPPKQDQEQATRKK